nr:hypothetical protein [Symmachiella dynata]
MAGDLEQLVRYTRIQEIVGDVIRLQASGVDLGGMAEVENTDGERSLARVIGLDHKLASLQVFAGGKGLSTDATVQFLGRPLDVVFSPNILGRIFRGSGEALDSGPDLSAEPHINVGGPTVNPVMRVMPTKMIETRVPMIDLFNCLVESQKFRSFRSPANHIANCWRASVFRPMPMCWSSADWD